MEKRVQLRITCSKHKELGTIARAMGRLEGYPATWDLDFRGNWPDAVSNHRRAYACGAEMKIEVDR